jgi:hypothetical protein
VSIGDIGNMCNVDHDNVFIADSCNVSIAHSGNVYTFDN